MRRWLMNGLIGAGVFLFFIIYWIVAIDGRLW